MRCARAGHLHVLTQAENDIFHQGSQTDMLGERRDAQVRGNIEVTQFAVS